MNQAEIHLQRFSLAVAWGLAALMTILPPSAYFLISHQYLQSELLVQTELSANDTADLIASNPAMWRYEDLRLMELLERRSKRPVAESRVVYDADAKIVAKNGSIVARPHISRSHDIYDAGTVVARIEITRSMDALLLRTVAIAICSAIVAAIVFFTLRTLPRRTIRKAYQALRENEKKYRTLHESMKEGMALHQVMFDENGVPSTLRIIDVNSSCAEMLGCNRQGLVGCDSLSVFGPAFRSHLPELFQVAEYGNSIAFELAMPDKSAFYLITAFSQKTDQITTLFEDITERKKSELKIRKMAYSDQLTELPNRALFLDRLNKAVTQSVQTGSTLAVFYLDLDRFKIFNDTLGRGTGDQLLIKVSQRLRQQIRFSDTLARMGEDEFCIVAINPGGELNTTHIAGKLMDSLRSPFRIGGRELHVNASIGIATFPDDGRDAETLVRNADLAMYSAKESGRNVYRFYSAEMNQVVRKRMEMEISMRNALERGEFFLEFQPIMDAHSGKIAAAEALVRWNHPTRGRIPPNEFIPLAEETGLILPLGEWVLNAVCCFMKQWSDAGLPRIRFSVNVSSRQLEQQDFAQVVREVLLATGANAAQLEIELTESCLIDHIGSNIAEVFGMRDWGVSIAIDDFGTGYSSLGYIKTLQIDHIKIDRSFVRDISTNLHDQAIVEAIIAMSQKLGIKNVAEGVETVEQLDFLRGQGCGEIQGYYFHRPLHADDFEMLLRRQAGLQTR